MIKPRFPMLELQCSKGHKWATVIVPYWFNLSHVKCAECGEIPGAARWGGEHELGSYKMTEDKLGVEQ